MSGGNRSRDHRKVVGGFACGVLLLAVLAAGNHWHLVAKTGSASPPDSTAASSLSAAPLSSATASSAPTPRHSAILSPTKRTRAPESAAPAMRSALARNPQKFSAGLAPVLSATLGRDDARYSVKNLRGGYSTENPANDMTASFTDEGVEIRREQAHWA